MVLRVRMAGLPRAARHTRASTKKKWPPLRKALYFLTLIYEYNPRRGGSSILEVFAPPDEQHCVGKKKYIDI